ncbi:hypothetical protein N7510_002048 [Penicillium lagena]|uniref:uncharacterized protein n=1 Tax=Penicillium lagena TaxID=94218 RepID=UPI002541704F|nr:uncharacterized protein N7510_002048 [Penicillium lagena]KAJ5625739.1 hypothetical protein N7510_002048 [Penicillium lagena]
MEKSAENVDNADDQKLEIAQAEGITFQAALEISKPNPWAKGYLHMYSVCALIFLCSTMNGYDGSLMGSINATPNYTRYYNLPAKGNAGTGIVFSIFNVGQMVGALFSWVADWQGRRLPIFVGCLGVCVGTVVTSVAPTIPAFLLSIVALLLVFITHFTTWYIAPLSYMSADGLMINKGSIIATAAVYGAHRNLADHGNMDWRLPLWLQMLCPGIVALGIWFCPESPRWLGRTAEARAIVARFHANGDSDHPLVQLEMSEMAKSLSEEGMVGWRNFFDLRVLVKSRARRYRLMLNMTFAWFSQFSGNNVASYYLPYLLENVGITDTNTKLLLNIVYAITGWIPAIAGARFHDIIGRRKMLLGATAGMTLALAVAAGTAAGYVHTGSKLDSNASIAFIYIFGSVFAFAWTSMQPIYPGEVLSNDMRAKGTVQLSRILFSFINHVSLHALGMGVWQITSGCASFVNTFAAPVALSKIGYWFYVFFVLWDVLEFCVIYMFFVETKGRTLEELDEVFEAPNPRKASTDATLLLRGGSTSGNGQDAVQQSTV